MSQLQQTHTLCYESKCNGSGIIFTISYDIETSKNQDEKKKMSKQQNKKKKWKKI